MSDLRIPARAAILAAAQDVRESAARLDDTAMLRRLGRLIDAVRSGARFRWELGALIVASPSGNVYRVTRAGCDCPNGRHGGAACWHWLARNLLEDMRETAAAVADDQASDSPPSPPAPLGARLAAARAAYM